MNVDSCLKGGLHSDGQRHRLKFNCRGPPHRFLCTCLLELLAIKSLKDICSSVLTDCVKLCLLAEAHNARLSGLPDGVVLPRATDSRSVMTQCSQFFVKREASASRPRVLRSLRCLAHQIFCCQGGALQPSSQYWELKLLMHNAVAS
eukprot:2959332-Amphidinium_carterae.1